VQNINSDQIPAHIAIIMDGNRRWAQKYGMPVKLGHKQGSQNLEKIIDCCIDSNVKYLTVYAFSTENWKRNQKEVEDLMNLLRSYFENDVKKLHKKGVKINILGEREGNVPKDILGKIKEIEKETKHNKKLSLNICFNYGGRTEIVSAVKSIAKKVSNGLLLISEIDEKLFQDCLYSSQTPDPDLIIRTGGESRISNFLLWQAAYSELYFTDTLWPDFNKKEFTKAIINFQNRERRYGKR